MPYRRYSRYGKRKRFVKSAFRRRKARNGSYRKRRRMQAIRNILRVLRVTQKPVRYDYVSNYHVEGKANYRTWKVLADDVSYEEKSPTIASRGTLGSLTYINDILTKVDAAITGTDIFAPISSTLRDNTYYVQKPRIDFWITNSYNYPIVLDLMWCSVKDDNSTYPFYELAQNNDIPEVYPNENEVKTFDFKGTEGTDFLKAWSPWDVPVKRLFGAGNTKYWKIRKRRRVYLNAGQTLKTCLKGRSLAMYNFWLYYHYTAGEISSPTYIDYKKGIVSCLVVAFAGAQNLLSTTASGDPGIELTGIPGGAINVRSRHTGTIWKSMWSVETPWITKYLSRDPVDQSGFTENDQTKLVIQTDLTVQPPDEK